MASLSPAAAACLAQRWRRVVGADALLLHTTSAEELQICNICKQQQSVLLRNSRCGHIACTGCWASHAADQVALLTNPYSSGPSNLLPDCIEAGCKACLSKELVEFAADQWPVVASFLNALPKDKNKVLDSGCSPLSCAICLEPHRVLLRNPGCQHAACDVCWKRFVELQLPLSKNMFRTQCFGIQCSAPVADEIWSRACTGSEAATRVFRDMARHIATLRRTAGWQAVFPTSPCGLLCPMCHEFRSMLLANPHCEHTACEGCWVSWAEQELIICREELRLQPRCLQPGCACAMEAGVWNHTSARSPLVYKFKDEMDALVCRVRRTAKATGSLLHWAPVPCEPGPCCSICSLRTPALLVNSCGHSACEDCWSTWIQEQLPQCRGRRARNARCLGASCQAEVDVGVWRHMCTLSETLQSLDDVLKKRQKLQANQLYPASMQVECPRAECLGLAYRGFSTMMCFICEYQWEADPLDSSPVILGEDLISGLGTKQCPSCNEHIIKNGGCDHMICRCGHEFWWTSLAPYYLHVRP